MLLERPGSLYLIVLWQMDLPGPRLDWESQIEVPGSGRFEDCNLHSAR